MDETRLFDLLGRIVETNQMVLAHNGRFLDFLKERDANVPDRTTLEIERLELDIENQKLDLERARERVYVQAVEHQAMRDMGTSPDDVRILQTKTLVSQAQRTAKYEQEMVAKKSA